MNRVCTKCNIEKPLSEFHKKKNGLHGVNSRCKLCVSIIDSNRWINISDELREKRKEQSREYYRSGKRKKQIRTKEQEKIKKKKQRENIEYKLRDNLRERVRKYIKRKNIPVDNKTSIMLGCTPTFLREYLESKFHEGMNWANYGEWHIDHIIPLATAVNESDLRNLCHYSNLQPLWALENLKKGYN